MEGGREGGNNCGVVLVVNILLYSMEGKTQNT